MAKILCIPSMVEPLSRRLGLPASYDGSNIYDGDVVIRWGNSEGDHDKVINPKRAIRLNVNKKDALVALMSAGVPTPRIFPQSVPTDVKVVIRPLSHSEGQDFMVRTGPVDVPPGCCATEFIDTTDEYRVWFVSGHGVHKFMMAKRVPVSDEQRGQTNPCRSKWGYEFLDSVPEDLRILSKQAAKTIGLEVGAADVLRTRDRWVFLELNSAPSVDHEKITLFYSNGLAELIREKHGQAITHQATPPAPPMRPSAGGSDLRGMANDLRDLHMVIGRLLCRLHDAGADPSGA